MNKAAIRKLLYRDVATILSKDDDLMPPLGNAREEQAWIEARDALVKELERRGDDGKTRRLERARRVSGR